MDLVGFGCNDSLEAMLKSWAVFHTGLQFSNLLLYYFHIGYKDI